MRKIGALPDPQQAAQFCDYLLTRQIPTNAEPSDGGSGKVEIWVRDEDRLEEAVSALQQFREDPQNPIFQVQGEAQKIREAQAKAIRRQRKLQRKTPAGGASIYFADRPIRCTVGIIVVSTLISLTTQFERGSRFDRQVLINASRDRLTVDQVQPSPQLSARVFRALSFVNIYDYAFSQLDASERPDPLASIRKGELWRVITPMFLHAGPMHLLFNMMLFYFLGGAIERLQGFRFMLALTLGCQVVAALVQALMPEALGGTPNAIGASGAGFGLFGYLWIRPLVVPSFPLRMPTINIVYILGFMVLCMFPWFPVPVANGAHVGGLVAGVAVAAALPRTWHP